MTYGLAGSCRAADVEGYGSNHGYEASVKQALDAAEYQECLHINGIRTQRKESRGQILVRSPDKSLKGFLLAIQSHLYNFALVFFFFKLPQPLWQFLQRALVYILKKKGGKPDRKSHLLFYGLRNPYRNIKSERNCTFMNSASGPIQHNDGTCLLTIYSPVIYTAPCIMFWMGAYTLRWEVGGGWALEFPSFLSPVKWERANRRVLFGAKKTQEFQGPTPSHFPK